MKMAICSIWTNGHKISSPGYSDNRCDLAWWRAFRRGIASNLFSMGVNKKIVQRILRYSKPHVTKERYIKAFDPDVIAAMRKMEETICELRSLGETNKRQWN